MVRWPADPAAPADGDPGAHAVRAAEEVDLQRGGHPLEHAHEPEELFHMLYGHMKLEWIW